jgi:hypothetical protein
VPLAIDVSPLETVAVRVAVLAQPIWHPSSVHALKNVTNRRTVGEKVDAMAVWDTRAKIPFVTVALEGLCLVE